MSQGSHSTTLRTWLQCTGPSSTPPSVPGSTSCATSRSGCAWPADNLPTGTSPTPDKAYAVAAPAIGGRPAAVTTASGKPASAAPGNRHRWGPATTSMWSCTITWMVTRWSVDRKARVEKKNRLEDDRPEKNWISSKRMMPPMAAPHRGN